METLGHFHRHPLARMRRGGATQPIRRYTCIPITCYLSLPQPLVNNDALQAWLGGREILPQQHNSSSEAPAAATLLFQVSLGAGLLVASRFCLPGAADVTQPVTSEHMSIVTVCRHGLGGGSFCPNSTTAVQQHQLLQPYFFR